MLTRMAQPYSWTESYSLSIRILAYLVGVDFGLLTFIRVDGEALLRAISSPIDSSGFYSLLLFKKIYVELHCQSIVAMLV